MMMMLTIYRAPIYPCCNSMLIALERPQSSSWLFLSLMFRTGYVCDAITHRILTWTTGSLSWAQMSMHAIAHGGVGTPKESLHWKLTLWETHRGIEPASAACQSDALSNWATSHPTCTWTSEPLDSDPCTSLKTQIPSQNGVSQESLPTDPISLSITTYDMHPEPGRKKRRSHLFSRRW